MNPIPLPQSVATQLVQSTSFIPLTRHYCNDSEFVETILSEYEADMGGVSGYFVVNTPDHFGIVVRLGHEKEFEEMVVHYEDEVKAANP